MGVAGAVVAGKLLDGNDQTMGFNAQTGVYEDLVAAGVIDPAKVAKGKTLHKQNCENLMFKQLALAAAGKGSATRRLLDSLPFELTKAYYLAQAYTTAYATGMKAIIWYDVFGWRNSGVLRTSLACQNGVRRIHPGGSSGQSVVSTEIPLAAAAS